MGGHTASLMGPVRDMATAEVAVVEEFYVVCLFFLRGYIGFDGDGVKLGGAGTQGWRISKSRPR